MWKEIEKSGKGIRQNLGKLRRKGKVGPRSQMIQISQMRLTLPCALYSVFKLLNNKILVLDSPRLSEDSSMLRILLPDPSRKHSLNLGLNTTSPSSVYLCQISKSFTVRIDLALDNSIVLLMERTFLFAKLYAKSLGGRWLSSSHPETLSGLEAQRTDIVVCWKHKLQDNWPHRTPRLRDNVGTSIVQVYSAMKQNNYQ